MGQVNKGELSKASFEIWGKLTDAGDLQDRKSGMDVKFQFNPATLSTKQENTFEKKENNQTASGIEYKSTGPVCLQIPDMIFDTYETRKSVRSEYIDKLEALMTYIKDTHVLPVIVFNWGEFSGSSKHNPDYAFFMKGLDVEYSLFLPDATPVRAKVKVSLEQIPWDRKDKQSPDHAKLYVVRQGDTLQGIATREYEDPGEWRRIAKLNNISDPLELRPGTKLLVPPILK